MKSCIDRIRLEGETAILLNNLLDNLCADYYIKRNEARIALQQALRDTDILNAIADEVLTILKRKQHGMVERNLGI